MGMGGIIIKTKCVLCSMHIAPQESEFKIIHLHLQLCIIQRQIFIAKHFLLL